jgi:hypothetical protein
VYDKQGIPPKETPLTDPEIAAKVLPLCNGKRSVGDIMECLPFSVFKTFLALSELLKCGAILQIADTDAVTTEAQVTKKLEKARVAKITGRWTQALRILEGLTAAHPGRSDVLEAMLGALEGFRASVYRHNFTPDDVPVVAIGREAMGELDLDPNAAFLVSRIDGHSPVSRILEMSTLEEVEGLRVFKRLLEAKIIDFPRRHDHAQTPGPEAKAAPNSGEA